MAITSFPILTRKEGETHSSVLADFFLEWKFNFILNLCVLRWNCSLIDVTLGQVEGCRTL